MNQIIFQANKLNRLILPIFIALFILVSSCKEENSQNKDCFAPESLIGKSATLSITDGSSPFASTGSAVIRFWSSVDNYSITGDGINVFNSAGSYTYSNDCNIGTLHHTYDTGGLTGAISVFTFVSSQSGNYTIQLSNANQKGTFQTD